MNILLIVSLVVLIINIPFGYWRANVKLFSLQWFLAIHIPVPVIIATRFYTNIGFSWQSYLFLVLAFFLGQKVGGILHKHLEKFEKVSSCLIMDLFKLISK